MKTFMLGALAALAMTATLTVQTSSADAQYYPPRPSYERPAYGYDSPPRPRYGYGRVGYTCTAVRNTVCRLSRPAPIGAYCECYRSSGGKREGYVTR
jgi:hypothetical protein